MASWHNWPTFPHSSSIVKRCARVAVSLHGTRNRSRPGSRLSSPVSRSLSTGCDVDGNAAGSRNARRRSCKLSRTLGVKRSSGTLLYTKTQRAQCCMLGNDDESPGAPAFRCRRGRPGLQNGTYQRALASQPTRACAGWNPRRRRPAPQEGYCRRTGRTWRLPSTASAGCEHCPRGPTDSVPVDDVRRKRAHGGGGQTTGCITWQSTTTCCSQKMASTPDVTVDPFASDASLCALNAVAASNDGNRNLDSADSNVDFPDATLPIAPQTENGTAGASTSIWRGCVSIRRPRPEGTWPTNLLDVPLGAKLRVQYRHDLLRDGNGTPSRPKQHRRRRSQGQRRLGRRLHQDLPRCDRRGRRRRRRRAARTPIRLPSSTAATVTSLPGRALPIIALHDLASPCVAQIGGARLHRAASCPPLLIVRSRYRCCTTGRVLSAGRPSITTLCRYLCAHLPKRTTGYDPEIGSSAEGNHALGRRC